ncbi:hypothetical protein AQUCO_00900389v1 [Aquilegia coerulea]|uniref:Uncharacterized protein n=1 Tax=Aquilegia coerulea TaxID=218851 RepID=A0A2G5EDD2_AQUCA|nr:hypothetical protein AQUCO_00900389v1 [Aquilegia coerulea]
MSRHRRQASQALPAMFNVTEESIASMVLDASQLGNNATTGGVGSGTANAATADSSKKNLAMGTGQLPPLTTNNQVVGLATNGKNSTVDGGSSVVN